MWSDGFTSPDRTAKMQLYTGLTACLDFCNHERPRQSPDGRTPAEERFLP